MDYAVDEMSISGTYTLTQWTQNWSAGATAPFSVTVPATRLTGSLANGSFFIWAATD